MTEAVTIQIVTTGGVVVVAIVGGIFALLQTRKQKAQEKRQLEHDAKISGAVEVVREQVQNSHGTNLRNDVDVVMEGQEQQAARLANIERDQKAQAEMLLSELRGLRRDIGRQADRDLDHGRHHERTDAKLDDIGTDLREHLEVSARAIGRIATLERNSKQGKATS